MTNTPSTAILVERTWSRGRKYERVASITDADLFAVSELHEIIFTVYMIDHAIIVAKIPFLF